MDLADCRLVVNIAQTESLIQSGRVRRDGGGYGRWRTGGIGSLGQCRDPIVVIGQPCQALDGPALAREHRNAAGTKTLNAQI